MPTTNRSTPVLSVWGQNKFVRPDNLKKKIDIEQFQWNSIYVYVCVKFSAILLAFKHRCKLPTSCVAINFIEYLSIQRRMQYN